jgi:hypothetical protein
MLPTSYEPLADEHPELRHVLSRISEWVRQHGDWNLLDSRVLAKDLPDVHEEELAAALQVLGTSNFFRRCYTVTTPSGVLADELYDHPRKIPERLPDRFNHYFDTEESDIVAVLTPR